MLVFCCKGQKRYALVRAEEKQCGRRTVSLWIGFGWVRVRMSSRDSGRKKRRLSDVGSSDGGTGGAGHRVEVLDVRAKIEAGFPAEVSKAKARNWKSLKQMAACENFDLLPLETPTYFSIEAPPSTRPAKKYCDLTGFPAKYTDPKTRLRFCSAEAFRFVRSLPEHRVQDFLTIRQAETRLK